MPTRSELAGVILFAVGVVLVAGGPTFGGIAGLIVGIGAVLCLSLGTVLVGAAAEAEPARDVGAD